MDKVVKLVLYFLHLFKEKYLMAAHFLFITHTNKKNIVTEIAPTLLYVHPPLMMSTIMKKH